MTKKIFLFLVIALYSLIHAQSITFVSEKTGKPLPKVSVFGKDGSILAFSDIDGKIDKQSLKADQEKFQLVYDNVSVATLSYSDFDKEVIKINDRIKDIEAVVIKNNKPDKYILVKGNFNAYVTSDNMLTSYADGIVTYIFNNKTKKLKSINVEQYRIFKLQDEMNGSFLSYTAGLEIPELKYLGKPEVYKTGKNTIKELKGDQSDQIEILDRIGSEKGFSFLGVTIYDHKKIINLSFEKGSGKTLRDLLEYSEIRSSKIKLKEKPNPSQLELYNNFYVTEFNFTNDDDIKKVNFNKSRSNYQKPYWQDPSFPTMQPVFSSFFKEDLRELPNNK
ncbi:MULTISPECIES: hypothetical protein [Chryseobacterium]|uniref:Uncharacterized protein n=1 Tax=Chryseobacterium camelliae TaxID=1265445 RepID=A0ABU0TPV9_9FLAO|nr:MULTISPECIES: hypothetical protein [Chryseobacterium]MDT3407785.1 hypothetical protein [Pseudacidovorax intermedius]MDQ1098360.1 hypothetical protein [Chryseobacterium camelliae]MDQ1102286.1 hypothetical protein [Chryseobacterium sp. SORGH_AS_1048]MDR6085724.1 hypothetical protein [Chryseobacterium sp. SORGH_AS_0909]MDR6130089.1 hypothetical protein [Chryseobacterium sp. SORGH_AS_1175]